MMSERLSGIGCRTRDRTSWKRPIGRSRQSVEETTANQSAGLASRATEEQICHTTAARMMSEPTVVPGATSDMSEKVLTSFCSVGLFVTFCSDHLMIRSFVSLKQ